MMLLLTPTPYPPFAFSAVSTMGLSAYLIYVGIYSAGISMSDDINLRQTIRKSAIEEAKLLSKYRISSDATAAGEKSY